MVPIHLPPSEASGANLTFGAHPVLVDAELNVIAGHGRLAACRELGLPRCRRSASIT